jgi:hypothetical protein
MLNLIIQDILKALIKNNYDTSYIKDVYEKEKDDKDKEDSNKQNTSEFSIFF